MNASRAPGFRVHQSTRHYRVVFATPPLGKPTDRKAFEVTVRGDDANEYDVVRLAEPLLQAEVGRDEAYAWSADRVTLLKYTP